MEGELYEIMVALILSQQSEMAVIVLTFGLYKLVYI